MNSWNEQWFGRPFLSDLDRTEWTFYARVSRAVLLFRGADRKMCYRVMDVFDGRVLSIGESYDLVFGNDYVEIRTMLKRELLNRGAAQAHAAAAEAELSDAKFEEAYPTLAAFLMLNVTGDGEVRERSKVNVFCEGGQWKACLADPGPRASLFVTLASPGDCFKVLEKALCAERPDWRRWKDSNGRGNGRK